jgi:hypothetical protein
VVEAVEKIYTRTIMVPVEIQRKKVLFEDHKDRSDKPVIRRTTLRESVVDAMNSIEETGFKQTLRWFALNHILTKLDKG